MKKFILFFSILWLSTISIYAQAVFEAIPQKKEVALNEPVRIQFVLTMKQGLKEVGKMIIPVFDNAQVVGRKTDSNIYSENENTKIEYIEEITLLPIKSGNLNIGPANIIIDGKKYKTRSFNIKVKDAPQKQEENVEKQEDNFLVLKLSKKNPYQNEGVIAQLKFYTKRIELLNSMTNLSSPNFRGLFVQPVKAKNNTYEQELVNGEIYLSRVVASYVFFPSKSGNLIIEPFALTLTISDSFFEEHEVNIKSTPTYLQVKNLPKNAPSDFYGLVGQFSIITSSDKKQITTNTPVNINVDIVGTGNFALVKLPEILVSQEIEQYPPKTKQDISSTLKGVVGKLHGTTLLVPQKKGNYDIHTKKISYFDPVEEKYKTLIASPVKIVVTPGVESKDKQTKDSLSPATPPNKEVQIEDYSQNKDNLITENISRENNSYILWIVLTGIILISVFLILIKKKKIKQQEEKLKKEEITNKLEENKQIIKAQPQEKKDFESELFKLKKIAEKGEDKIAFYTLLEELLNQVATLKIPNAEKLQTTVDFEEKFVDKYGEELSGEWKDMLLKSQIERYSSLSDKDSLQDIYVKAEELIKKMS